VDVCDVTGMKLRACNEWSAFNWNGTWWPNMLAELEETGIAGVLFFIGQFNRRSMEAVSYIDIVMTSSLEMTGACWMSSWCGCPWHTVQYLPLCSRGGGPCLHTRYFHIACFTSMYFVMWAHKTAPWRFSITWWRTVWLSVDAIVHCFSKHGVSLSVWVSVWTRPVYQ
jgi:hypothetical protein